MEKFSQLQRFLWMSKEVFPKFKIFRMKNTRVMDDIRKINSGAAFRGVERRTCTIPRARVFFRTKLTPTKNCLIALITFSSHTEYVKKKNSLLLTNVHDLYVLEDKTSHKIFPSVCLCVCLSICLDVWMYVRTWTFHVDTINI